MCLELRVFYPYRKPHGREFASRLCGSVAMSDMRAHSPAMSPAVSPAVSPALPAALSAALASRLDGRGRQELKARAQRLSEAYRARQPTAGTIRDEDDALAYALTRLPATYAATIAVLGRLHLEQPDLTPLSLLDAGSGTGAAAWAACAVWPELAQVTMLDRSRAFLALAGALAAGSGAAPLNAADFVNADLTRLPATLAGGDLVIAAYALTELAETALPAVAEALWERVLSTGALVLVEPGTPRDHARLMAVRDRLITLGARIVAPCPHQTACPVAGDDWCHFSVRLPRSRDHMFLKEGVVPFEDEKFSYIVARRVGAPATGRIIAPLRLAKPGVTARLCEPAGINETFTPRRDKPAYDMMRRKDWGDAVAPSRALSGENQ